MTPALYTPPVAVLRCARVALEALRRGRWWLATRESNLYACYAVRPDEEGDARMTATNVDFGAASGVYCAAMSDLSPPPYPSLAEAHRVAGASGVVALLAWVVAAHPPGVSSLTDAAYQLGATTREQANRGAEHLRRAARVHAFPLPTYPRGARKGTAAYERAMAARTKPAENKASAKIDRESSTPR